MASQSIGIGAQLSPSIHGAECAGGRRLRLPSFQYSGPSRSRNFTSVTIEHMHGAPCHPQMQGKIERERQNLKNRIKLENDYFLGDLEAKVGACDHAEIARKVSPRNKMALPLISKSIPTSVPMAHMLENGLPTQSINPIIMLTAPSNR